MRAEWTLLAEMRERKQGQDSEGVEVRVKQKINVGIHIINERKLKNV